MNILFIGKRFYTNRDALAERFGRIYQLPRHWSEAGHAVRLWLVDYHHRRDQAETHAALEVFSTQTPSASLLRRYRHESRGGFPAAARPDLVIASGDCYIGLMAYRLARKARARFVFDVYDKYDEFGAYRRLPFFDPFRFLLRHATARLFASRALMDELGREEGRDVFAPNGIDASLFRPMDMHTSRRACGLPEHAICVGYFGSMNPDRGIDDLLEAHRRLRNEGDDLHLVLGGKARTGLGLDGEGVHYLGNLTHAEVPRAMACCDALVLPNRSTPYLDMASSCKIAEYMAAERPIVATRTPNLLSNFPDQARQLDDLLASAGDVSSLMGAIRNQLRERRLVQVPEGVAWSAIADRVLQELTSPFSPH